MKKSVERVLLVIPEYWYFVSHRQDLAKAAAKKGYKVALISSAPEQTFNGEQEDLEFYPWNIARGSLNPVNALKSIYKLGRCIEDFEPDLIHAVSIKPIIFLTVLSIFYRSKNMVHEWAGLGYFFGSNRFQIKVIRKLLLMLYRLLTLNGNHTIIVQNLDDLAHIKSRKIATSKNVILIPGVGVDTEKFRCTELPVWSEESPPIVGLPARLIASKGVYEFVRVAAKFKMSPHRVRFALIGARDPQNHESIASDQILEWVSSGVVEYWGNSHQMPTVYERLSIICFPSYGEGMSKTLFEAASSGRPIVCFDVPGCRDFVENGVTGLLVESKNEDQLFHAVERILKCRELAMSMGKKGRVLVTNRHSVKSSTDLYISAWES